MGQFYYRPVPTGYEELGRGLASGITGGVGNYFAGKEAERKEGIEDEDRTRRRSREDLDLDVMLASAGGGRGIAPTTAGPPRQGSTPGDHMMDAVIAPDAGPSREYRQMGDFYIEDPTSRSNRMERETFELGQGRAATERARLGKSLGGAGAALVGGTGGVEDYEAFYGEGKDPLSAVREGRPKAPVRGTEAYLDMVEDEERLKQRYRGQGDDDELPVIGSIEFNRAYDIVADMATERNPEGYPTGYNMTEEDLISTTQALLRGEDPFAFVEGQPNRGAMAGYGKGTISEIMKKGAREARREGGPGAALTSPSTPSAPRRPAEDPPVDDTPESPTRASIIDAIRKYRAEGLTQEQALKRLREDGLIGQ